MNDQRKREQLSVLGGCMTDDFHELAGKYEYSAGMTRSAAEARAREELDEIEERENERDPESY
jgi:hypothetical protein